MHDDPMAASTSGEADVCVTAQRAFNSSAVDGLRPPVQIGRASAPRKAELARRLEARRLRSNPDVLTLAQTIWS
jgi:hypothetical protein